MKYAVISDIHGNMQALEAVMNDIKNEEKITNILCLGDIALAGPQPQLTVNKIKELVEMDGAVCIQGNTDKMIADYSEEVLADLRSKNQIMANALESDVKLLSDEQKEFLRNLPEQANIEYSNTNVLLVHGSPRQNDENIFPDMPIEHVEEIVGRVDADVILCGHTHVPCGYQTNSRKTVVNAGSVGRPFSDEPKACYAILDLGLGCISVKHKYVAYDIDKAASLLRERAYEGSEKIAEMLIHATSRYPQ